MGYTFSRLEMINRFQKSAESGHPIIGTGASCGLIGKAAECAGVDFIVLYSTGRSRLMGQGTRLVGDANRISLEMHEELYQVVNHTPLIAGLDANDPFNWDHKKLLKKFIDSGVSGIIHNPMIGIYGTEYVSIRDSAGCGFERELELTRMAHDLGLYTMCYTWTVYETVEMVKAGTDMIIAHVGGTGGGLTGIPHKSVDECVKIINTLIKAAKDTNPETVCLAHGGPFKDPESVKDIYRYSDAIGYIGASSVERIPLENAIMSTVTAFKNIPLRR